MKHGEHNESWEAGYQAACQEAGKARDLLEKVYSYLQSRNQLDRMTLLSQVAAFLGPRR